MGYSMVAVGVPSATRWAVGRHWVQFYISDWGNARQSRTIICFTGSRENTVCRGVPAPTRGHQFRLTIGCCIFHLPVHLRNKSTCARFGHKRKISLSNNESTVLKHSIHSDLEFESWLLRSCDYWLEYICRVWCVKSSRSGSEVNISQGSADIP